MLDKNEKAIKSAQTVSFLRAVSNTEDDSAIRSEDYMAKYFLDKKYKYLLRAAPHSFLKALIQVTAPGSYCSIIIRTKHFDNTLLKEIRNGIKQVVFLGAGYDTRSYRFMDQMKGVSIFEVDLPVTQVTKKKRLLKVCEVLPDNVTYIAIDFNKQSLEKILLDNGFSIYLKTLFLWEGVSYYLPESSVENVFQFVSKCETGSSILFDYAIRSFVEGDVSTYGGEKFAKWLKQIQEPFLFGLNATETRKFVNDSGLELVSDYGAEDFEKKYLYTTYGKLFGKTIGHFRIAHARVI